MNHAPDTAPSPPLARPARRAGLRALALCVVAFTLGNATWAAWDQDITNDERFHLGWPERLLEERNDAREQFRFDSKTPALLPSVLLRNALQASGVESDQMLRFATRLPSVALLALVVFVVFLLARSGEADTPWLAVLLAALDANLAAHASVATTDLAYSLVVLLFAFALARGRAGLRSAALLGVLLGVALSVKYTSVLLIPIALLALGRRDPMLRERVAAIAVATLSAWFTTCTLYLWVGVMAPLSSIPLTTPLLKALVSVAPSLPFPLPRSVLTGIDMSMAHDRADFWPSYIFGAQHPGGIWYYFLAHWLMKTPVALIALVLAGTWRLRHRWRDPMNLALGGLLLIHLVYFSLLFATQIGLRFALPCVALSCALAARGLGRVKPVWILALAALALAERTPYWGDPLAFTNLTVWPKSRAYWYTADSNLDWGQNRDRVVRYAKEQGRALILDQPNITPGLYVARANDLAISDRRRALHLLVDKEVPASLVGFTHFAFSVTGDLFEEYMDVDRTVSAADTGDQLCAPPLDHYPPGAQIPFRQTESPDGGRLFLVCVTSRKGADIGFTTTTGRVWFGRMTPRGDCEADILQEGQQAWFRVPKAVEARLCLREMPNRRAVVAYEAAGYLTVRGQGADLALRRSAAATAEPNDDSGPSK